LKSHECINTLENILNKIHLDNSYENWIHNFSLNINDIWKEKSASDLIRFIKNKQSNSAIIIGAGPSLIKHNHLELLSKSNYRGTIICTDRILAPALKAGVTPDKFNKFYVITIDTAQIIKNFYKDKIIKKYANRINGIFTTVTHPDTISAARNLGIKIHWVHALIDYDEGKKSFNQMSALMVRAKRPKGLPAIQTGGNVGTSAWFIAWRILKCKIVCLIGIDHSWSENDSWNSMARHCNVPINMNKNSQIFTQLFPRVYNPEFDTICILDPIFQYYSNALKDFIQRSTSKVKTINATQGGCIFGKDIKCVSFKDFLITYSK